jgi:hypothetical protein
LSNAGLKGQIPNEISKLRKLVSLDLSALFFPRVLDASLAKPHNSSNNKCYSLV